MVCSPPAPRKFLRPLVEPQPSCPIPLNSSLKTQVYTDPSRTYSSATNEQPKKSHEVLASTAALPQPRVPILVCLWEGWVTMALGQCGGCKAWDAVVLCCSVGRGEGIGGGGNRALALGSPSYRARVGSCWGWGMERAGGAVRVKAAVKHWWAFKPTPIPWSLAQLP